MAEHNFHESLALSESYSEAPWWEEVYREAFPGFVTMSRVLDDGWGQRGGIDRVVTLSSGKSLTVDEKVRTKDWGDILLEKWSDYERRVPGWIQKDLACDYIAYAFVESQRCYLLPFLTLRRAWELYGEVWWSLGNDRNHQTHRIVPAKNRNHGRAYTTVSVTVPVGDLLAAVKDAMVVHWGNPRISPPIGQQALFGAVS